MKKLLHLSLLFVAVLYSCSSQKAVTKTVTGVVIIEDGNLPLPGVSIQVKQKRKDTSKRETTTDIDGKFEIQVKKGETLIISFLGCRNKEVKITDKNNYIITLSVWTL